MPEAWGQILLKIPADIQIDFDVRNVRCVNRNRMTWKTLKKLVTEAGILDKPEVYEEFCFLSEEMFLYTSAINADEFISINVLGDEWMLATQQLVCHGRQIEIYGWISHEYGYDEYYSLNHLGQQFCDGFDFEQTDIDDDILGIDSVKRGWLRTIPGSVKRRFATVFDIAENEEAPALKVVGH